MKKHSFWIALGCLAAFGMWTAAVCLIDVQAIGPRGTTVGLASLNRWVHDRTGVHMTLYTVTDWLSLIPAAFAVGFAALGLAQWIGRKHLRRVDRNILVLGAFYGAVLTVYLLFERWVINYRPVLIDGMLEASYPSSTTMLVLTVMTTAILQLRGRIKRAGLRRAVLWGVGVFTLLMVAGRLISGVHWVTDIVGGMLLSGALVLLYTAFAE